MIIDSLGPTSRKGALSKQSRNGNLERKSSMLEIIDTQTDGECHVEDFKNVIWLGSNAVSDLCYQFRNVNARKFIVDDMLHFLIALVHDLGPDICSCRLNFDHVAGWLRIDV